MAVDIARLDRYVRIGLLVLASLLGGLDYWLEGQNVWVKSGFVIAVAGLVGYFTNFLAIKMLFQPKQGQVLGWRGLVPKNKAQIARSLGASVQEQLLSPDIILGYIRERRLIETATQSLADWIDRGLQNPKVRRSITRRLVELLDARGSEMIASGFDLSEEALKRAARNPKLIATAWQQIRAMVFEFLQTESNREMAAEKVRALFLKQLPNIAEWVDQTLEEYLRQKRTVGSVGLGLKSIISLDQDAIQQLLTRFAEDPQVGEQLMVGLDSVIDNLQKQLETEETQAMIQAQLASWVEHLAELARKHILPATVEHLDAYLENVENWATIEELLINSLSWSKDRALSFLSSDAGQNYLRVMIERAVQRLNVTELVEEQVMKLDTDELESMVLDNTGGNLTIIQVLGGGLGIIAGTVQVHLVFAIPIFLLVAIVFVAYRINEWQQSRLQKREKIAASAGGEA